MVGIQLLTPLLVYFLAEELALSGILAVVAAGIAQGVERDRLRLTSARMQIISANVWEMIAAVLSGLVFVLLGVSLPNVVIEALRGQGYSACSLASVLSSTWPNPLFASSGVGRY